MAYLYERNGLSLMEKRRIAARETACRYKNPKKNP